MSPKDALDRLRADPGDAAAWAVVHAEIALLAQRISDNAGFRDFAIASVRAKVQDQAIAGDLDEILAPRAWLSTMLRRRVIDAARKAERQRLAGERAAVEERQRQEAAAREPEPFGPELVGILEQLYERAVSRRDEWQRDHLRRAWAQLQALHTEGRTLREIVVADEGLERAEPAEVDRAVQRAHKAHQRARESLLATLEWRVARGDLDAETAARARVALTRLKRRQDTAAPRVSGNGRTRNAH